MDFHISIKPCHGRIFDIIDTRNPLLITDYHHLNRELVARVGGLELGEKLNRKSITSIKELTSEFKAYIAAVIEILNGITIFGSCKFHFSIKESEEKLLAEQLVFDILFEKYLEESELMTRNGYSSYMAEKLSGAPNKDYCHAIDAQLTRGMKNFHDRISNREEYQAQLHLLGINPDMYSKYYNPNMKENSSSKKPKYIWDYFCYNFNINISHRQYRRQLTKEGRNYPYEEIVNDLKKYNAFVNKLLPVEKEEFKKYFHMSMDYYVLESYKRIDFMLKLIAYMKQNELAEITKEHFLVKRFHLAVLVPYEENGNLAYRSIIKYYRPLFMLEDELLKEMQNDDTLDYSKYGIRLQNYQIIRAKAYELFKYHARFVSTDYEDIKGFLCKSYDMRQYHASTEIWKTIEEMEWKKTDPNFRQHIAEQLQQLLSINNAFFWKFSN